MPIKTCLEGEVLSLKNRCVKKDGRAGREALGLIKKRSSRGSPTKRKPTYKEMVMKAIEVLNDKNGSSR